jgi:hypothetical protein
MHRKRTLVTALSVLALAAPAAGVAQADDGGWYSHAAAPAAARDEVRIVGKISAISSTSLTVMNRNQTLTFKVPARIDVSGFHVGQRVEAEGEMRAGKLVLTKLHREDRHGDDD